MEGQKNETKVLFFESMQILRTWTHRSSRYRHSNSNDDHPSRTPERNEKIYLSFVIDILTS